MHLIYKWTSTSYLEYSKSIETELPIGITKDNTLFTYKMSQQSTIKVLDLTVHPDSTDEGVWQLLQTLTPHWDRSQIQLQVRSQHYHFQENNWKHLFLIFQLFGFFFLQGEVFRIWFKGYSQVLQLLHLPKWFARPV